MTKLIIIIIIMFMIFSFFPEPTPPPSTTIEPTIDPRISGKYDNNDSTINTLFIINKNYDIISLFSIPVR